MRNGKENGIHADWRWDNGEKLMKANFKDEDLHVLYKGWHSNWGSSKYRAIQRRKGRWTMGSLV